MTVLEALQRSAEFLTGKTVDSPRLQAELLLAHVLKLKRMALYLSFERALSEAELSSYRELIKRRAAREPLQHIIGSTSFCGLEISLSRDVLIPRPETEILAEQGWQFLNQLAAVGEGAPRALDLGTGSGCLAIALAAKSPATMVVASDISKAALVVAQANATHNNVHEKISFLESNAFESLDAGARFYLIISNPPYIPSAEIELLEPEVRDHDPRGALDGGPDGLDFYRVIARQGQKFLEARGKCMVEFGDGQQDELRKIFEEQNWIVDSIIEDYTHRPRIMIASRRG